ncbi:MAG: hypothetical protein ACYSU0_07545, partial [Planctomycetota bacterium]
LSRVLARAERAAKDTYGGAYHAALVLVLLEELGPGGIAPPDLGRKLAARLVEIQRPSGGWGDVSRTEFACIGLSAAGRIGARAPGEAWRRVERFLRGRELPGGGWGYQEGDEPTGSMTAGGTLGLVEAGAGRDEEAVSRGLAWLAARFRVDANPGEGSPKRRSGGPRHRFYYLASLAALARAMDEWPRPEWARRGATALVAEQGPDGRWKGEPQDRPTEFATLFLVEARRAFLPTHGKASAARDGRATVAFGLCSPGRSRLSPAALAALERSVTRWSDLGPTIRCRQVRPARDELAGLAFVLVLPGASTPLAEADVAELARLFALGGTVLVEGPPREPTGRTDGRSPAGVGRLALYVGGRERREALVKLAGRIAGGEGNSSVTEAGRVLEGPAPLGAAEAPELLLVRAAPGKSPGRERSPGGAEAGRPRGAVHSAPAAVTAGLPSGANAPGKEPGAARGVLVAPEGLFALLGREDPGSRSAAARAAANVFAWAASR